jgi:hypothetical protein
MPPALASRFLLHPRPRQRPRRRNAALDNSTLAFLRPLGDLLEHVRLRSFDPEFVFGVSMGRQGPRKPKGFNKILTMVYQLGAGHSGAGMSADRPASSESVDNGVRPRRASNPDRSRCDDAAFGSGKDDDVAPLERNHASILRKGEPWILNFELIKYIATRWDGSPYSFSDSEMTAGAFSLARAAR